MRTHNESAAIIRQLIQHWLPNALHPASVQAIVDTMILSNNSHVIFYEDEFGQITHEVKTVGSIKRFVFKNKLVNSTENPILAITYDYVRQIDLYHRDNNFERETQHPEGAHSSSYRRSPSATASSRRGSIGQGSSRHGSSGQGSSRHGSSGQGSSGQGVSSEMPAEYPDPPSPVGNPTYDFLKRQYEDIRRTLYG